MERIQKWKLSLVVAFIVIMFTASLNAVHATLIISSALPDWLEKQITLMYPNASSTQLDQVRTQVSEQIALNQKRIAETNGAVLNFKLSTITSGSCMSQYLYNEAWNGGVVYNPANLEDLVDYTYAEFYTPNLNQTAAIVGQMSSTNAGGDVYIASKLGPNGAGHTGNIFNVWVSNSSAQYGDWRYLRFCASNSAL